MSTSGVEKGYIVRKEKGSGNYTDWYREGIEMLQKLSGANWTDYNEHDPGVTILENVLYTLTSINYKSQLPIADLLTESKGEALASGDNGFFIPSEILTTNPVTEFDLRKLLIDQVTNVRNVWVKDHCPNNNHNLPTVRGLYNLYIELFNYHSSEDEAMAEQKRIIKEVKQLYHQHRNLCEDLYRVYVMKPFRFNLRLSVTLQSMKKGEEILAQIFYTIRDYLSHEIRFYSLWELKKQGRAIQTIFNGPNLENGFIPNSEFKKEIDTIIPSEIIKKIAKVKGVVSVDLFELSYHKDGKKQVVDENGFTVPDNHTAFLVFPENSSALRFQHEGVAFTPDLKDVKKQLSYIEALNYGNFKSASLSANKIEIPSGKQLNIGSYYPVREQFPLVYGIGHYGLQTGLPKERYAQANQLKAYLLPFDQIMGNALAQISNLYTLYGTQNKNIHSYFFQELEDMPNLINLIRQHHADDEKEVLQKWKKVLQKLQEKFDRKGLVRLNQAADNLLSRFAEQFPEYALQKINSTCYGKQNTKSDFEQNVLFWKRNFLAQYGEVSYNRNKAFDYLYTGQNVDETTIPGIVRKACLTLGIENPHLRSLSKVIAQSGIKIYQRKDGLEVIGEKLEIVYSGDEPDVVAIDDIVIIDETVENLTGSFYYLGNASTILEDILREGTQYENYEIKHTTHEKPHKYYVIFRKEGKKSNVVHISDSRKKAQKAISECVNFLSELNRASEGIYLLEHLLLAPPYTGDFFGFNFSVQTDSNAVFSFEQIELKNNNQRNQDLIALRQCFTSPKNIEFHNVNARHQYYIRIFSTSGDQLAQSEHPFDTHDAAADAIEQLKAFLKSNTNVHPLDNLVCNAHFGENKVKEDFFTFRASFILPSWPTRFQDENFQTQFNNVIGENAPLHIGTRSFWVPLQEMVEFEKVFYQWKSLLTQREEANPKTLELSFQLIQKLKQFKKEADRKKLLKTNG